jgi:hypothetical protein
MDFERIFRDVTVHEVTGFILVVGLVFVIGCLVARSRLPQSLKMIVYAALALRLVGSMTRYAVLFGFYRGSGDARVYYGRGLEYAEYFTRFDFSPIYDPDLWLRPGQWWGTPFMSFPSGFVLSAIGPSLLGSFLVFSLLAMLGLVGFGIAFRRAHPEVPVSRYLVWVFLFPSLWYWPSSLGKDALLLMGLGLAVAGYVGARDRIQWPLLAIGLFFVFAIRPQVAAVVMLSIILAQWLSGAGGWNFRRVTQGIAILAAGLGLIYVSMSFVGVSTFDADGVTSYIEHQASTAAHGESAIGEEGAGISGMIYAPFIILFRPFPWEAGNLMALFSSIEIWAFWALAWWRRREILQGLKLWRQDRLLRLAIPFILVYSVTLGMLIVNLGIVARQRIFLFPFLFLFFAAYPAYRNRVVTAPTPAPEKAVRQPGPVHSGAAP